MSKISKILVTLSFLGLLIYAWGRLYWIDELVYFGLGLFAFGPVVNTIRICFKD